jgi:hypothetical protein
MLSQAKQRKWWYSYSLIIIELFRLSARLLIQNFVALLYLDCVPKPKMFHSFFSETWTHEADQSTSHRECISSPDRKAKYKVFIDDNKNLLSNSFKGTAHQDGSA